MRNLLMAVVLGLVGVAVGYFQHLKKSEGVTESFMDPIARLRKEMKEKGQEFVQSLDKTVPDYKVEVEGGTTHDFGSMEIGTSRKHSFVFKNVGASPCTLVVKGSTCKCTIGEIENPTVNPGESTSVDLTWTAQSMLTEFAQTATIEVQPIQEEIKLVVRGFVSKSLEIVPRRILMGDVYSRETKTVKTMLYSHYEKPLEVNELIWGDRSTADKVKLSTEIRKLEPGESETYKDAKYVAEISIEFAAGMPSGPFNGLVELKTNLNEREQLQFMVTGKFLSDVRIVGGPNYEERTNILEIGKVKSSEGGGAKFIMGIKLDGDKMPTIKASKINPKESLEVKIGEPSRRGSQALFPIELVIPKGAPPVSLMGTNPTNFGRLEFETDLEYSPRVNVILRLEVEDR